MAQKIKAEVRLGAEARRERQYNQVLTLHEDRIRLDEPEERPAARPRRSVGSLQTNSEQGDSEHDAGMVSSPNTSPPSSSKSSPVCPDCVADNFVAPPLPTSPEYTVWNLLGIDKDQGLSIAQDVETDFTITFLDYVFPFLFPFYQPSVLEGGRSWLLAMLRNNTAFFHSGMSLSAYFFTLIMKGGERHQVCSQLIWNKLVGHVDSAVRTMQQDMEDLKRGQDGQTTIFQRGKTMESIVQLLILEHSMARTNDWNVHLSAAMAIFQELFDEYGTDKDGTPNLAAVVQTMSKRSWLEGLWTDKVVWHSDQGAFRFYTAALIYHDIIASTCLETPPRLRNYHNIIVSDDTSQPPVENIRMENFFGCQGWVFLAISDIAVLDAWKKENKARGTFCQNQLMDNGSLLHQRIQNGLNRLERESFKKRQFDITAVLRSYYRPDAAHQVRVDEQVSATRIWALAAMAYVSVVVTGWSAATRTTASSIAIAMQLLYGISSPAVLRSLAWPFYVLGCLATSEQEQLFTHMASSMGPLLEFGTIGEAIRIMKKVWELRDSDGLDSETWDIASCSRVFGTYVLMT
ncbi:unnamed protein product [Discula destructiva]